MLRSLICLLILCMAPADGDVQMKKGSDAVEVRIDGKLFTRYVFAGAPKPYCYPIIGPIRLGRITRSYPMEKVAGESNDHPHQRSFWFTFGDVNGIDFWSEAPTAGKIIHRGFEKLDGGVIRTRNDWIAPDGKKVCEDVRELRISDQTIDFKITIKASNGPVKFGDTKEGMMGIRVADTMSVDKGSGHIVNSRGQKDADAWGKQAEWCDCYGPVDGKMVGIAIMDHPTSFRYPTYWHVRTYGLFATNPFGLKAFTNGKIADGSYTIPAGKKITFRYRILIHEGTTEEAKIAEAYSKYAKTK